MPTEPTERPVVTFGNYRHRECSNLLLDIAELLMASGAHTERVNRNILRIAKILGYDVQVFFSFSGVTLTLVCDHGDDYEHTSFRRIKGYGVNMSVVSAISRLSWKAGVESMTLVEIRTEVERVRSIPHYSKIKLVTMISLAGMAFCRLAGGEPLAMLLAGLATALGFTTRNALLNRGYNLALSVGAASFIASGVSGLGIPLEIGQKPEIAVATSVLFLIPGVPMINSIIDLMHGHITIGQGRAMQGVVIAFSIAMGIVLSSGLLGVNQL